MLGDEPGPSGSIDGHGLRLSGRSGDPGGRGDADDYYYEVKCANPFLTLFYSSVWGGGGGPEIGQYDFTRLLSMHFCIIGVIHRTNRPTYGGYYFRSQ